MLIVRTECELRTALNGKQSVGFVPTMGALHAGHCSLIERARTENDTVVLSIFVNPKQFGPNEDFDSYPRTFQEDKEKAEVAGADIVFAPTADVIYPDGFSTSVDVSAVAEPLCGGGRPGHFKGVATVVARLFGLVQPNRAYFGLKDMQQCMVLQRMVLDLAIPVQLVLCPTVREADGLAMSSRNQYLNGREREIAPMIYQSLQQVLSAYEGGENSVATLELLGRSQLAACTEFEVEYFEVRSVPNLAELKSIPETAAPNIEAKAVCAVAARLGTTRLIDNILLK